MATFQGAAAGRLLGNPVFNWVGTRSYGLYLIHWPVYQAIRQYAGVPLSAGQFVLAMAITLPVTELSYRYVETPIRKGRLTEWWRNRSRRPSPAHPLDNRRRPVVAVGIAVVAVVGFSVVSIAVADNRCVGDVECTLVQADPPTATTVTTASVPGTGAPSSTVVTVPGQSIGPDSTSVETTTTLSATPPAMVAFGESVMLGAKSALTAGGFEVDARESRQAPEMAQEIAARRAANQVGPTVVIQVGTNGDVSDSTFAAIMAQLPPATTPNVFFLTVKANQPWIARNNAKIFALPAQYPNVKVIDWNGRAAEIAGELSKSDGGAHLRTTKAMQFYANMIFDNIGRSDLDKPLQ